MALAAVRQPPPPDSLDGAARSPLVDHADPYAYCSELRPAHRSVVADLRYEWHDDDWMALRTDCHDQPMSIYELHLGSWRKRSGDEPSDDPPDWYTYDELADLLPDYLTELGVTHVEFCPSMSILSTGAGVTSQRASSRRRAATVDPHRLGALWWHHPRHRGRHATVQGRRQALAAGMLGQAGEAPCVSGKRGWGCFALTMRRRWWGAGSSGKSIMKRSKVRNSVATNVDVLQRFRR